MTKAESDSGFAKKLGLYERGLLLKTRLRRLLLIDFDSA